MIAELRAQRRLPIAPALKPRDIVESGLCIGCGVCVASAARPGLSMGMNALEQLEPVGDRAWANTPFETLASICPFSPAAMNETHLGAQLFPGAAQESELIGRYDSAYVGYVAEGEYRERGSSGGMVSWVAAELLKSGLVDGVAHVVPGVDAGDSERLFRYRISRTEAEIRQGAKSRYYPIELSEVIEAMRRTPGRYAVVGIPCFIKAVRLLSQVDSELRERIAFTLGLFCGHMKSTRLIESFAYQMGVGLTEVARVEYRVKNPGRPANWYTVQLELRDGRRLQRDWFHLAEGDWGSGFFQHSACNYCDDVVAETADVSFGDAWVEPYSSDGRGTNVVVVRSKVVGSLIERAIGEGRLALEWVDESFVRETQAAGFRQRREGLAYRLTWSKMSPRRLIPKKRVRPSKNNLQLRRKLIYRSRAMISTWSHRLFRLARRTGTHRAYLWWARASLAVYQGLAYSRGRVGRWLVFFADTFNIVRSSRRVTDLARSSSGSAPDR